MKIRLTSLLVALVGFLATSQSTLAASRKADARNAALVAALQAVSPDPLGGRLGLAATGTRSDVSPATLSSTANATSANRGFTAQSSRAMIDQRAYFIWKSSLKS